MPAAMMQPLVNRKYLMERFPGKGGWTYIVLPDLPQQKDNPLGKFRVRGSIDGVAIKGYHLMPLGNGRLFLPVKAAIRKQIRKEAGAEVLLVLYPDPEPTVIPEELIACLSVAPEALRVFRSYTDNNQKAFADWIYAAKTEQTKARRILKSIEKLLQHKKHADPY